MSMYHLCYDGSYYLARDDENKRTRYIIIHDVPLAGLVIRHRRDVSSWDSVADSTEIVMLFHTFDEYNRSGVRKLQVLRRNPEWYYFVVF